MDEQNPDTVSSRDVLSPTEDIMLVNLTRMFVGMRDYQNDGEGNEMTHVYNVSLLRVKALDDNISVLEFSGVVGTTTEPRTIVMYILAAELEAMKQQLCGNGSRSAVESEAATDGEEGN